MKAILVKKPGRAEDLYLAEVPPPSLTEQGVRIKVQASTLNRADILQRKGLYPPPKGQSPILGIEVCGTVIETGPLASRFSKGQRVMALVEGGGYADEAVAPQGLVMPLSDSLSFTQGAAIPEAFTTASTLHCCAITSRNAT